MALLSVENISKTFGDNHVLQNVNLTVNKGEIVSILGLSGRGKSTLFNIVAGLEKPDSGKILLGGSDITGKCGNVSYMLQKDLLLPFYTVIDNVILPCTVRGEKKEGRKKEGSSTL